MMLGPKIFDLMSSDFSRETDLGFSKLFEMGRYTASLCLVLPDGKLVIGQ